MGSSHQDKSDCAAADGEERKLSSVRGRKATRGGRDIFSTVCESVVSNREEGVDKGLGEEEEGVLPLESGLGWTDASQQQQEALVYKDPSKGEPF